ncbi:hypothetical protein D3C76_1180860 [compost metagenome]
MVASELPVFPGYVIEQLVTVADELHLGLGAVDDLPVEDLYAIHDVVVSAVVRQVVTARGAHIGTADDRLSIVAAGGGDFSAEAGLLLDVLLGQIGVGMDLVFGNVSQALGKSLPGFVVDAVIAFEEFGVGAAITADGFTCGKCRCGTRDIPRDFVSAIVL